ncbi:MAG: secondary thiamine-phosphate synthase enzyme YjbQ [Methylococcales bacterium]|nr:secondary thiamine-phosphate synthase enzyme YjbQ [Methylococcales bacterium]
MWIQKEISLSVKRRGFHLITSDVLKRVPEISRINTGLMHLFMMHTSASLAVNENADPDVRIDMESYFNHTVPENASYFKHILEGADDMPAHIKASILGESLTIPVSNGELKMGIWQGIYLCEHRNNAESRSIVVTLNGE